jgi:hypothetical protein
MDMKAGERERERERERGGGVRGGALQFYTVDIAFYFMMKNK